MSWSLGEAQALAIKAARGAGLPWGLAEEAGLALRWLEARGLPGAAALAAASPLMEVGDAKTVRARLEVGKVGGASCPIRLGAALLDFGAAVGIHDLGDVRWPLLLAPFLARSGFVGALEWPGAAVEFASGDAEFFGENLFADRAVCNLAMAIPRSRPATAAKVGDRVFVASARRCTRVPESAASHMAILAKLAARTYAPATETSRTGAGAGLSDND